MQPVCRTDIKLTLKTHSYMHWGFSDSSDDKESACNVGDPGLIPGLGRSPGEKWLPTPVFLPGEFH